MGMADMGAAQGHDIFAGRLVRLRGIEPEDWEVFYAWNKDTDMARSLYWIPFPQSRESVRQWAMRQSAREVKDDHFDFVIETLAGEVVGSIGTNDCQPQHGTFGYGVGVRREHARRGYAAEAISLLLRYFFRERRYQKATVHVYDYNEPSLRLHEKLGFVREGRLRRMLYQDGRYIDVVVLGMTAEEFAARRDAGA